ncbi:class I SAM-dependent methyltransferase [Blastochloris sulfoviridis]|uniref:Class I SAM-dependent methyltransferase n=1 Tax=Blastochloris sulfoviridis TaxID=50712 RepID=A0A5M6I216_9HYPH|nr:SAM-dependent methyltransferase [Blastochloris sulfoviridis]KAA5602244.1 class I SAM-dependent methyltransferase [Blastochloris sulfoviridis]
MTPLGRELADLIRADGPLSVARFMALCLGHPRHGYYLTRDPLGRAGDFVTAPEISQMFGELIGLWCADAWNRMGAPERVALVELGPGRGTLMADALRALKVVPALRATLAVHLVETSPALMARQRAALEAAGVPAGVPVFWHARLADAPDGPSLIVANEFLDALPVTQLVRGRDGWHERQVGLDSDGRLAFGLSPARLPDSLVPAALRTAPPGSLVEVSPERAAAVREIARRLVAHGGAALIVDYGHTQSGLGDTLQAVKGHAFADPLAEPGEADLTSHVDFAALAAAARAEGAAVHGPVTQGAFLAALGIDVRAARLKAAAPDQAADIDAALHRLTAPDAMGNLFKVLAIADPKLGPLAGFAG